MIGFAAGSLNVFFAQVHNVYVIAVWLGDVLNHAGFSVVLCSAQSLLTVHVVLTHAVQKEACQNSQHPLYTLCFCFQCSQGPGDVLFFDCGVNVLHVHFWQISSGDVSSSSNIQLHIKS